ncbi:MAG: hypothetical protein ACREQ9_10625, partial [Candidatus Binatia bacterium]
TTLDRDNGLVRYDLEEACRIVREPCICGETTSRAFWGGRFAHLLSIGGRRFQVAEVERALRTVPDVTSPTLEYVVVRPAGDEGPLRVRVERGQGASDLAAASARCRAAVEQRLGVRAEVELVERETLPRSSYKAVRLVER